MSCAMAQPVCSGLNVLRPLPVLRLLLFVDRTVRGFKLPHYHMHINGLSGTSEAGHTPKPLIIPQVCACGFVSFIP